MPTKDSKNDANFLLVTTVITYSSDIKEAYSSFV
ncbi:hypothetical protein SAMN05216480_10435 [Pustulibacterium marinum]|uniref:Uncharacterized protein n=1 Tax=Pustulibacterium marinum TaxID=1224947 RepID=A0A1I7GAS8_9FLAO|nr:hypothetical protein SAMN05216480_10435 [Pustulibacterium marinum]